MKKKFTSILLVLVMVLAMMPMAMGTAWADISNIGDVLDTVVGGFPASSPSNEYWKGAAYCMYKNGNDLQIDTSTIPLSTNVTENSGNYSCTHNYINLNFYMQDGHLVKVVATGDVIGTFLPPAGSQANPWKVGSPNESDVIAYVNSGVLHIEGSGAMKDFDALSTVAPWDGSAATSVQIGEGITNIGKDAFTACSQIKSIKIPASVADIGVRALSGCTSLATITTLAETPPAVQADTFSGSTAIISINVPQGKAFTYMQASGWSEYAEQFAVKVADVLATAEGSFPETPEEGWVNENGNMIYITNSGNYLTYAPSYYVQMSQLLTKEGNNYKYASSGITITFNMSAAKKLESIKIENFTQLVEVDPNGTYTASVSETQTAPAAVPSYFSYDAAQYSSILAEAMKLQAEIDKKKAEEVKEEKPEVTEKITVEEAKALTEATVPTVRTENVARGIKVYVKDSEEIEKLKASGYIVLYDFYRAEGKTAPKAEDYKITAVVNKKEPWYLNTAAKKGHKYYYKAIAKVYDADGELVTETELDQGLYGARTRK